MLKRVVPAHVAGLMLLALAGCAAKKDGPPPPMHVAGSINLSPDDPRAKELMRIMCAHADCRRAEAVHLRIPNAPDLVEETTLHTPYDNRQLGAIFILVGETLSFEMEEKAWGPADMHLVEKVAHPERTVTVKLEQRPELADGYGMRLTISNPFGKALKYSVRQVRPGSGQAPEDVVGLCPALPHGESVKTWPYPLRMTMIANLSFVPTEHAEACAP
jgi:hypothetical protein